MMTILCLSPGGQAWAPVPAVCSRAGEKEPKIHLFHWKRHKGHSELPKSRRAVASYEES